MKSSRRYFLRTALSAPLAGTLGISSARLLRAGPLAQEEERFQNPEVIRYDAKCFTIQGKDTFVFSAAFHYPRCPKALWRDRLEKLKRAGFNTIETYVFWNYHEPQEGKADLSEFEEFVQLVKQMGLWMIARPGPYVCAEWERGGIPNWIAAQHFPLRSNDPQSIESSQHWFNLVLPVIQRQQITTGGPVIMVQVENEYDYWKLPDAQKLAYVRALANMCSAAGINVPLITCWTKQARENSDPYMASIMDTCNFYPRWNIVKEVPPKLAQLRREEPDSPVGVTELQGGWFSEFGGKLSVDQDGVNATQLNMVTKTVIEQGATYFNYYMGFGGTSFDWTAKNLTTTYDYAAPLREPGGLWEKYYAARGIGAALGVFGETLTRTGAVPGVPQSTNPNVSVTQRLGARSGVVFVRENANAEQRYKMYFQDPASPTRRVIAAPREGELVLGAREMKMLPVQIPIPGSTLRYTTGEVLAAGLLLDRHYLIVYDEPGRLVEIGLASPETPKVEGDYLYNYWDEDFESVVLGVRVDKAEKLLLVNNHLLVVVVPRDRALRSWTAEFPTKVVPGAEEPKPMLVPFITDSYQLAASGSDGKGIWAELDFQPGEHQMTILLPPAPNKGRLDGVPFKPQYEQPWRRTSLSVTTPPLPVQSLGLNQVEFWVERFDPGSGEWRSGPLRALEDLGPVPYGYVKYRASFTYDGQAKMFLATFGGDAKKVFLNGELVEEASNAEKNAEFILEKHAQPGSNLLEIAYERFGSPNFGPELGELSGIESARLGKSAQESSTIEAWQMQRFPLPARGHEIDPAAPASGWQSANLGEVSAMGELAPAFTWCRAEFALPAVPTGWTIPWKLTFEAARDALLYLNGRFVGRYVTVGPQKDFYLPDPFFNAGGEKNVLTVVLAYADRPGYIRTLSVAPYEEFAARRTRVEFEW
ncbi:MAG: beta-galactosidase [Acidobacteriia bacterium]|nr:beta-galactosidase [Terriglobia bacterium]